MKLASCDNCGVLIDLDKLEPLNCYDDYDYCYLNDNVIYKDGDYYSIILCPVCKEKIRYEKV